METSARGAESCPPAGDVPRDERIVALYERGQSLREVGAACGVSRQTVLNVLRARGVARRPYWPRSRPVPVPEAAEIGRRYAAGTSLARLSRAYPYGTTRLRRALAEGGVPLRPPGSERRFSDAEAAAICARYQAGESIGALAQRLGCYGMTIHRILVRRGVPRRPPVRPKASP